MDGCRGVYPRACRQIHPCVSFLRLYQEHGSACFGALLRRNGIYASGPYCRQTVDLQPIRRSAYAIGVTAICVVTAILVGRVPASPFRRSTFFWHERNDPVPGSPLSLFRGRKDCLDIETVLTGLVLANAPDFIDDGVLLHRLFSISSFRCADHRTFTCMLRQMKASGLAIAAFANVGRNSRLPENPFRAPLRWRCWAASVAALRGILPEARMLDANSATSRVMSSSGISWIDFNRSRAAMGSPALASSTTSCEM